MQWTETGPGEDDLPFRGVRTPAFRSQAFPPEILERFIAEIEEAKRMDLLQTRFTAWMRSYGRVVEPLKYGCRIDGLMAELQFQSSNRPLPFLRRPMMESQDLFVVSNREATECLLVRSDIRFRRGPFFWFFDSSDASKRTIPSL